MHIYINVFRLFKNSGHSRRSVSNLAWNNTISERQPCARVLCTLLHAVFSPQTVPRTPHDPNLDPWAKTTWTVLDCLCRHHYCRPKVFLHTHTHTNIYMYVYIYTEDFVMITNVIIFWIYSGRVFRAKSALII